MSPQGSDVEVEVPANLSKYTEAVLAFTRHSSLVRDKSFPAFKQKNPLFIIQFVTCFVLANSTVFKVIHSGYMGSFVQT